MIYLKDLWARITVRWHVVLAAILAALPSLLDYLGFIDLKPILIAFGVSEDAAKLVVNFTPFALAFIKPVLAVAPSEYSESE